MTAPKLDPDSEALLRDQVDSFEKLELLRALRTADRPMAASELEISCRLAPETVRDVLGSLLQLRIVERDDNGTLFRMAAAGRAPAFETLLSIYEEDRSIVMRALSARAMERIRGMAARAFADAFLLRKRGGDDG